MYILTQDFAEAGQMISMLNISRQGMPYRGGSSYVLTPRGALSPNFAQKRSFCLKIASKLYDFEKKILGARGAGPVGPPGSAGALYIRLYIY